MQLPPLPNELWYIIFKMRTKMILDDHYASWMKVYKGFNDQLAVNLVLLWCDDYHTQVITVPTRSHNDLTQWRKWRKTQIVGEWYRKECRTYNHDLNRKLDLVWYTHTPIYHGCKELKWILYWNDGNSHYDIYDYNGNRITQITQCDSNCTININRKRFIPKNISYS